MEFSCVKVIKVKISIGFYYCKLEVKDLENILI